MKHALSSLSISSLIWDVNWWLNLRGGCFSYLSLVGTLLDRFPRQIEHFIIIPCKIVPILFNLINSTIWFMSSSVRNPQLRSLVYRVPTDHVTQTMNYLLLCFLRPDSQWWLAYQTPKSYSTDMDLHCPSCLINFFHFRVILHLWAQRMIPWPFFVTGKESISMPISSILLFASLNIPSLFFNRFSNDNAIKCWVVVGVAYDVLSLRNLMTI